MAFCATETAHRVGAKPCLVCLKAAHEEEIESHTQWRAFFASSFFFASVSEARWLLNPRTGCLADMRSWLLPGLKLFESEGVGKCAAAGRAVAWPFAGL